MYCLPAGKYRLRGWDRLPRALVSMESGTAAFAGEDMMQTLFR